MAPSYEPGKLPSMKRAELQKLAKKHGIKANMKTDDLISALQAAAAIAETTEEKPATSNTEQETSGTACSSTEDQSEPEVPVSKPKSRRGRGRKQKAVESKKEDTPVEAEAVDQKPEVVSGPETEVSSTTEDEAVSPAAKKGKTKATRRGRGRGRKAAKNKKEEVEELPVVSSPKETKPTTPVAASPVPVASPAINAGKSRRSKQATPSVVNRAEDVTATTQATVPASPFPTPPNSAGTRRTLRATRTSSQGATPTQLTIPTTTKTPEAIPEVAPKTSSGKRTRSASKTTPAATKTPEVAAEPKPTGSSGKKGGRSSGSASKKVRRSTFDKSPAKSESASSKLTTSSSSLKEEIMAEIEKKVELAKSKSGIPTRIPVTKKTPSKRNWTKMHHGAFDKMESIDDYIERKRKRTEALSQSAAKRPKTPTVVKSVTKPNKPNTLSFTSPKPNTKSTTGAKSAGPSKSVSFKMSKLKTPSKPVLPSFLATHSSLGKRQPTPGARKSVSVLTPGRKSVGGVTPGRKSFGGVTPGNTRKSLGNTKPAPRKSVGSVTPFKPTTPAAKPKNMFDLKASLSKPLTYKPHTGKLKPFGETTSSLANVKPPSNIVNAKTMLKKPQIKGRDNRRLVSMKHKANKRNDSFMARRGISGF